MSSLSPEQDSEAVAALDAFAKQQMEITAAVKKELLELARAEPEERRKLLLAKIKGVADLGLIDANARAALTASVESNAFSMDTGSLAPALAQAMPQMVASGGMTTMAAGNDPGNWPHAGVIVGAMVGGAMGGLPGAAIGATVGGAGGHIIGRILNQLLR